MHGTRTLIPAAEPDMHSGVTFGLSFTYDDTAAHHITPVGGCLVEETTHGRGWHVYATARHAEQVPAAELPDTANREGYLLTAAADDLGIREAFFDYEEEAASDGTWSYVYVRVSAPHGDVDEDGHRSQWWKVRVADDTED